MAALRASYHRILDKVEHMLPAKLRPFYNHPAGNLTSLTFLVLTRKLDVSQPRRCDCYPPEPQLCTFAIS